MAEDIELATAMLDEQPALANTLHEAFDDPFRAKRFAVATLLFAVVGPPQQTVRWHQVRRPINRPMIDLLLDRGADPNIYSRHGRPLCWARELDIIERLVGAGGDINLWHDNGGSPLNFSVWQLDARRMQIQLAQGADVHGRDPANGDGLLHTLANTARSGWAGNQDAVESCLKLLLAAGADVSATNHAGSTALDIAESRGDKVLAALLSSAAAG